MTVAVTLIMGLLLGLVLYGLVALRLSREGRRIVETCTRRPEPPGDEDVLFAPHRVPPAPIRTAPNALAGVTFPQRR
jgi:hypothetical protein